MTHQSKPAHCFWGGTSVLEQAHRHTTHIHFCSQLCLQFVVKVLDVELVCEALQVGAAGQAWEESGCVCGNGLPGAGSLGLLCLALK